MSAKKNAIICIAGEAPNADICSWNTDVCIAADSGVCTCDNLGYTPDCIIGDFDSVSFADAKTLFPTARTIAHEVEKDKTDTELAILHAREQGCDDITLVGGQGGELDHFIGLLYLFMRPYAPTRIVMKDTQIELITEYFSVDMYEGQNISFFPSVHDGIPTKQKSTGLRWNLDTHELSSAFTSSRNRAVKKRVEVTMERGRLIAVWQHHNKAQQCS